MSNHELRTGSLDAAHRRSTKKIKPGKMAGDDAEPALVKGAKANSSVAQRLTRLGGPLAGPLRVVKNASRALWAMWVRAYDDALNRPAHAVRVLGTVVAVLTVVAGLAWYQADHYARLDAARIDAVEQGEAAVARLLSYNFAGMDRQIERTQDAMTGKFKDDYAQLIKSRIVPGAKDKLVSVQTSVDRSAVISSSLSEIVLLMYVDTDSETQSDSLADGDSALRGVRVTVEKEDGKWKVSELIPV